jgi:uncharacterized protein (DUF58 family)
MRRSETLVALLAVVLASLAALQIHGRLYFAAAAVALLVYVCFARVRASIQQRKPSPGFSSYDRAEKIREERERRLDR